METYEVVETFTSINGEGKKAGRLAFFIRLKGCNLSCSYCDTKWANEKKAPYELLELPQLVQKVQEAQVDLVTITGGEPMLHKDIEALIGAIIMGTGAEVEVETNGSIPIEPWKNRDSKFTMTMDYKLPSSNMEESMCLDNMEQLKPWDVVKFVIGSQEDLRRAKEIIDRYHLCQRAIVYFSPVFGTIPLEDIVGFMKDEHLTKVRFQVQIHKVVWDPNQTGV